MQKVVVSEDQEVDEKADERRTQQAGRFGDLKASGSAGRSQCARVSKRAGRAGKGLAVGGHWHGQICAVGEGKGD